VRLWRAILARWASAKILSLEKPPLALEMELELLLAFRGLGPGLWPIGTAF